MGFGAPDFKKKRKIILWLSQTTSEHSLNITNVGARAYIFSQKSVKYCSSSEYWYTTFMIVWYTFVEIQPIKGNKVTNRLLHAAKLSRVNLHTVSIFCMLFFISQFQKNPFKCQQGGTCKYSLDSRNRKYCKSCRLDKCIYIGMKVKYILTEQEKAIKLQKIEENR